MARNNLTPSERAVAAGKLKDALRSIPDTQDKQHAYSLEWSRPTLSHTINGRRTPSQSELDNLDAYLLEHVAAGYVKADVHAWYTPSVESGDTGDADGRIAPKTAWGLPFIGAAILVLAVLLATPFVTWYLTDRAATSAAPCQSEPGELEGGDIVAVPEEAKRYGCTTNRLVTWNNGWRQDFVDDAGRPGAVIGRTLDSLTFLAGSLWQSYSQVDRTAQAAREPLGFPTSQPYIDSGYTVLDLDRGGILIAERPYGPYRWLPREAIEPWRGTGGIAGTLGAPTSNPYPDGGEWRQDFTHGYATTPATNAAEIAITLVDGPAASLPPGLTSAIIRQSDGTAWWILDGNREWIPDGRTWVCLGGDDELATNNGGVRMTETPGYVLTAYPYSKNAECP